MKSKILVMLFSATVCASAGSFTLNAASTGFYGDTGSFVASGNYAAGWYTNSNPNNIELRDYFIFDLSSVSGTITSATLHLQTGSPAYLSNDSSETFTLFDISSGLATLAAGTGGTSAFADLGTGTSYGSVVVTSSAGSSIDINLNAAALTFLQANNGQIGIGGAITTLAKGGTTEALFNSTGANFTRQLQIETSASVPEPATSFVVGCGLCGLLFLGRRGSVR